MAPKVYDRVKEYTVSTGVGGITFVGSFNGFQRFSDVLSAGETTYYVIEENDKWEVGIGTYGSNNLERDTVLSSSNGGSKINLGGSGVVSITYPAGRAAFSDEIDYVSGVAVYASGLVGGGSATVNELNYVSGIAVYSSGQAITNKADISTNSSDINYASGVADYASGQAVSNEGQISSVSGWADSTFLKSDDDSYVSGVAVYASGQTIANKSDIAANTSNISTNTSRVNYASGQAISNQSNISTNTGNISTNTAKVNYASGQAIENESQISSVSGWAGAYADAGDASVSGWADSTFIKLDDDSYVSGIADYASGQAIVNESDIATNTSNISTNASRVVYASGQAIQNEIDILYVSGVAAAGGGGDVTTQQLEYVSGIALYSSGQAIENESQISSVSGWAGVYADAGDASVSGWASSTFLSSDDDAYVSGVASYASGQAILNESEIVSVSGWAESYVDSQDHNAIAVSGWADSTFIKIDDDSYVSGVAAYASGQAIENEFQISSVSGWAGVYTDAGDVSVSGWADSTFIKTDDDSYVSGIAAYSSGQVVSNQASISTNASNISSNTAKVDYASGLAITNEADISYVSGVATKTFTVTAADTNNYTFDGMGLNSDTDPTIYLHKGHTYYFDKQTSSHPFRVSTSNGGAVYQDADGNDIEIIGQGVLKFEVPQDAPDKLYYYCTSHASMNGVIYTTTNVDDISYVSGIAVYASGEAGGSTPYDDTYVSGVAVYASGQVDVASAGNAEASKAIILDSDKSFYGVKHGNFNEFDSWVNSSGVSIGPSGLVLDRNTPSDTTDTLYNVLGTLYFNGSQLASAGGASSEAQYASGQAIENEIDIAYVSGIAVYASGNSGGGGGDVTTEQLEYVSGIAVYGSGLDSFLLNPSGAGGISVTSDPNFVIFSGDATLARTSDLNAVSGIAVYGSGHTLQTVTDNGASTTNALTITNNNITASSGLFDVLDMTLLGNGSTPAYQEGVIFYDSENHTLSLYNDEADVTHQLGQEQLLRVRNNTGATIPNGAAVLINGAHGNAAPTISGAIATSEADSQAVGLATHSIEDGSFGYVTTYGIVRDIDTSAFSTGDEVFLSATQIGSGVAVAPVIPNYKISLGHVINSASSNGSMLVQVGSPKLGGGDLKSEAPLNMSGVPFVTTISDTTAGGSQTDPLFVYDDANRQLRLGSGVQLLDGAPSNTSNVLYNDGGTLSFNGSAVGGASLTAGSGITIDGADKINVYGGSGHFVGLQNDGVTTLNSGIKTVINTETDGATITFDMNTANSHASTLGGNRTLAVSNVDAGQRFFIKLSQDGVGSRTVTWWSTINWLTSDGSAPTLKTDPGADDYLGFVCTSAGNYDGFHLTGGTSYTAGSGLTLQGTEFNVYGGSGHFQNIQLETTGTEDALLLTSTDAGSGAAPVISTMRDSASPADGDYLGQLKFKGRSDTGTERVYAKVTGKTLDVTNGTEDGVIEFMVRADGSNKIISRFRNDGLRILNDGSLLIQDGGNVGIRNTSPSYPLDVEGDAHVASGLLVGDTLDVSGVSTFDQVATFQSGIKTNINTEADATTITFDMDQSNVHMVILGDNRTLAVSNVDVGQKFLVRLQQDSTGSRTVTWWNNIQWAEGGTEPTLTTTGGKADLFGFLSPSGGYYDGFVVGQNI